MGGVQRTAGMRGKALQVDGGNLSSKLVERKVREGGPLGGPLPPGSPLSPLHSPGSPEGGAIKLEEDAYPLLTVTRSLGDLKYSLGMLLFPSGHRCGPVHGPPMQD